MGGWGGGVGGGRRVGEVAALSPSFRLDVIKELQRITLILNNNTVDVTWHQVLKYGTFLFQQNGRGAPTTRFKQKLLRVRVVN